MSFFKETLLQIFKVQMICISLLFLFSILLTYKKTSPFLSIISISIIFILSYLIHIIFSLNIFKNISPHLIFHHNDDENINKKYLFIEFFINIFLFIIIYFINYYLLFGFIPNILIFYSATIYVTNHLINYSLLNLSPSHILHHKYIHCNYGIGLLDHLFGTNCDDQVENFDYIIPNVVFAFFLTYIIFRPKIF
jgi:hypothetical protein